jgi:hypothetical protein
VNYYSSASVKYNNIPTGDANNTNALLLIQRRFLMQAVGNEASTCSSSAIGNNFILINAI